MHTPHGCHPSAGIHIIQYNRPQQKMALLYNVARSMTCGLSVWLPSARPSWKDSAITTHNKISCVHLHASDTIQMHACQIYPQSSMQFTGRCHGCCNCGGQELLHPAMTKRFCQIRVAAGAATDRSRSQFSILHATNTGAHAHQTGG